jgi:tetratricopeptide (TPR) repeat protein
MILHRSICLHAAAIWASLSLASSLSAAEEKFKFPDASQHATITQRVGLTDVTVDYSRPGIRGREIFGGLVPYGKVWRTGANASTKIKFSDAVKIGGKEVAAGEYSFFTIPDKEEWTIILSKNTKLWGAYDYKEDTDAVRVAAKPETLSAPVESFTIAFDDLKDDGATIVLKWDKTRLPIELTTNTVEKVNAEITAALKDSKALDARFYYQAASFYYEHEKDLEQALKWVDQAIAKKSDAYSFYYKKAQIEVKLGHKEAAKAAAEKSIELLKAGKTPDETAIRNSQLLIDGLH